MASALWRRSVGEAVPLECVAAVAGCRQMLAAALHTGESNAQIAPCGGNKSEQQDALRVGQDRPLLSPHNDGLQTPWSVSSPPRPPTLRRSFFSTAYSRTGCRLHANAAQIRDATARPQACGAAAAALSSPATCTAASAAVPAAVAALAGAGASHSHRIHSSDATAAYAAARTPRATASAAPAAAPAFPSWWLGASVPSAAAGAPRRLHGMVSVMTAAESARDMLSAITHPVSYGELAAHLMRDYSAELFDALSGLVLCHVEELTGPELSNLLWAYTTVGHHDPGLVSAVVQSLAGKLPELGPSDLANALWAMARNGLYDQDFVASASERVWDGLPATSPRQLAAMLQAYAYFRQRDPQLEEDEDLLRSIGSKFGAQVTSANVAEVALVLSSLARLRRYDPAMLAAGCQALRRAAPTAPLCVLAEAMWALALLQHRDAGLMDAVADRVAEAARLAAGLVPPPAVAAGISNSLPLPLRPSQPEARGRKGKGTITVGASAPGGAAAAAASVAAHLQSHEEQLFAAQQRRQQQRQQAESNASSSSSSGSAGAAGPSGRGGRGLRSHAAALAVGNRPVRYSSLWPTSVGPGGHGSPCTLYEQFNPALPFDWQSSSSSGGSSHSSESGGQAAVSRLGDAAAGAASPAVPSAEADAAALLDADTVSKLLWSYGTLHCYSSALYTLLFRQLPRLHHDRVSWSALARLLGSQLKALELQPGPGGLCKINPLEAESPTAWSRLMRSRAPLHRLPEHLLPAAFVALHAEALGRDHDWTHPSGAPPTAAIDPMQPQPPNLLLSRPVLEAEVAASLRGMGLWLRPSATIDGMFNLPHTILINGLTLTVEVLSAACCTLDPPHRPMGPAAARLRSLQFRGWLTLVVPFGEWEALAAQEGPKALAMVEKPDGGEQRARALAVAAAARQRYLLRKLEALVGEELDITELQRAQKASRRRMG